jgi:hypothetical protein
VLSEADFLSRLGLIFPALTVPAVRAMFFKPKTHTVDFAYFQEALKKKPEMMFVAMESLSHQDAPEPKRRLSVLERKNE